MSASDLMVPLAGWGRYPRAECHVASLTRSSQARALVGNARTLIPRGAGRAYGDAALNEGLTIDCTGMDRLLEFDEATGTVTCEAGVLLAELIEVFLPRGWFVPVTPGTKFVTVGGLIASDVHGKNHHRHGSFCDWLDWIDLCLADGSIKRCFRQQNPDLFAASCGGMGLTGLILRACFRMSRVETAKIRQKTIHAANVDAAMKTLEFTSDWTYSVAWFDAAARGKSLGRSVIHLGEHASETELPAELRQSPFARPSRKQLAVPLDFPAFALSGASVRLFNAFIYHKDREGYALVDIERYFYPLDVIAGWNRIYGRRGFVQYQCVLPDKNSREGIIQLLERISSAGLGSFLAVLKRMGAQSFGMLSFPIPGYTLALDFPVSGETLSLLGHLDEIVMACGGRIYLTKDSRAPAHVIAASYPRLDEFREVRRDWKLEKFSSLLSQRLEI